MKVDGLWHFFFVAALSFGRETLEAENCFLTRKCTDAMFTWHVSGRDVTDSAHIHFFLK